MEWLCEKGISFREGYTSAKLVANYVVIMIQFITNFLCCIAFRDLTSYGILMATISCLNLDFVSMDVLMGI